jgi:hypothetical protein
MSESSVAQTGALPDHPTSLEPEMSHTTGEIALERTEHERCAPVASQRCQLVQMSGLGPGRHLGI